MMNSILLLLISLAPHGRVMSLVDNGVVYDRTPRLVPQEEVKAEEKIGEESLPLPSPLPVARVGISSDPGFAWHLQGSFGNAVFHDLSFADDSFGFACAELGVVYRTTNSGQSWSEVMNLGFPYYWYGIHAIDRHNVIVTGFNDTTHSGVYRWTTDAGTSWGPIVRLDTENWFREVRFADSLRGIISVGWNGAIWRTENGGRNPQDWSYVQVDSSRGWYSGGFTFLPNGSSYVTGITFCHSRDYGTSWDVQHSIDPVFDGGVSFPDTVCGWTGGGQISAPVEGWIHSTSDAGQTWSDRLIVTPEPIRSLKFGNDTLGFAVGGNIYSGVGAIYSTTDGGATWRRDTNTLDEMCGIDAVWMGDTLDVWSAGFNSAFTGFIYKTRIIPGATGIQQSPAANLKPQAPVFLPNPAVRRVRITGGAGTPIELLNVAGRKVRTWPAGATALDLTGLKPGCYILRTNGRSCPLVLLGNE